ncbi:LOW QUALITY PROTEIN: plasminogen activator, urokinase receptor [Sarotherodon galilaeus]
MLSMTVEGTELPFLVDTGATYSTLRDTPDCATLSSSTVSVVGFSGIPMTLPLTDPALTQLGKQTLKHQYVVSPQVPVNLMGRDLLVKLGATIMCSADGLTVTLPGGKEFPCLGSPSKTQYLVRDSEQSTADIYWGRLVEEGILRTYQQWRPWIMSLAVYSEPRDPYHVTLFYDKEEDDTYREQFESDLEGETWKVKTHNIYIGPEGVAAAVKLTDEQLPWYNVGEDSAPHITLAVHVGHEARELGPMVKRALDNSWWQEHKEISRTHGREKTDHPDAVAELPKLPDTLWSRGPTDVGLASCSPVLFELKSDAPINKPQYRHKPEADAGIAETIEGLLQVLKEALSQCKLPEGCTLIQYVDDLLIAAPSVAACTAASLAVLNRLAECGFKVSKEKLQLVRPEVTFLGRVIAHRSVGLMNTHRDQILTHPKPRTVKELLSFLGYSRQFIPNYAGKTAPLRDLIKKVGARNLKAELSWTPATESAFISLKQDLSRATDLATPNYDEPFYLDVSETNDIVNGVLFQKKGGSRDVLMYVSIKLGPIEARHPTCTRHAAGVAKIIQKTAHIVREHPLKVLTTHSVVAYVNSQAFTMTPLKQQRLSKILDAPNLTFTHEGINMADLMGSGEPHDCVKRAQVEEKVREDLKAEPIAGAEEWFTDGCCHRDEEGLKAGYAVVRRVGQEYQVIEAGRIEGQQSAQRAEVIALIRALRLAKNLKVNIYTDSAYAFGAAHVELAQWKRTGYITATNATICHKKEMEELEKALEDPDEGDNPVARGNQTADEAAKKAAGYKGQRQMVQVTAEEEVSTNTLEEVRQAQKEAAPEEKGVWQAKGAWQEEGLWRSPDGRPVLTTKMAKQKSTGFTPYELLTGRQFPAPWTVVSAEQPQKRNRSHAEYFNELKALVSSFTKQVTCEKPREKGEVPDAKAVWLKVIKRKWKEPRWTGPYEVTARTATAVQLRGKGDTWFHWTQCAAADESLVDEDPAPPDTGGNESKRQNKSSPLCNGPIGSLPERPKQEEPLRRRSTRLQKGATTN